MYTRYKATKCKLQRSTLNFKNILIIAFFIFELQEKIKLSKEIMKFV